MELLPPNLENLKARDTPSDSLVSELAKDESTEFARPVESSSQGTHMTDSVPSDWTNEKHHLFLESMEASFVSQMFDSAHSVGSCHSKENSSRTKLLGQSQSASHVHPHFGQFKVLRRGSWKNINFESTESRSNLSNDYKALSHNPWIHHFKAARKNKNVACKSQAIRACDSDLSQQYISSNKEVSDQNFVDEDTEVKKGNSDCNAKRVNTSETNALINDQVVP